MKKYGDLYGVYAKNALNSFDVLRQMSALAASFNRHGLLQGRRVLELLHHAYMWAVR